MPVTIGTTPAVGGTPRAGEPVSAWTDTNSAKRFAGSFNLSAYWDKDADGNPTSISAAALEAGQTTDAEISLAWRARLKSAGVDYVALATTDADEMTWLRQTANWGITVHSYEGRGENDSGNTTSDVALDGKMASMRKRYEARLAAIRDGSALLVAQADAGVADPDETDAGQISFVDIDDGRSYGRGRDEFAG